MVLTVEREVPNFLRKAIRLRLISPTRLYIRRRLADVCEWFGGANTAQADRCDVSTGLCPRILGQRVAYLATLENLEVEPADEAAKLSLTLALAPSLLVPGC